MPTPSPLEYAPRPPMHRRRMFRRLCVATLIIASVSSGWWWGPPVWSRLQLLYWQHECLAYVQVPGQLVFDSFSGKSVVPHAWQEFYSRYSPPGMNSTGTIFLGVMKSPAGNRRFVAIDSFHDSNFFGANISAQAHVFEDSGTMLRLIIAPQKEPAVLGSPLEGGVDPVLKVYAASRDPYNPSHVTFETQEDDLHFKYDVWLQDDDSIVIGKEK